MYSAGTAILSKFRPLSVDYTLPGHPDTKHVKGRIVTVEFDTLYVIGTYVVNAGTGLKVLLHGTYLRLETKHPHRL